jgi:hypothetical protein
VAGAKSETIKLLSLEIQLKSYLVSWKRTRKTILNSLHVPTDNSYIGMPNEFS